jgi:uncharacterized protein YeeX (DUF496 family)
MDILRIKYEKKRDQILNNRKTSDLQKSGLLFNNWKDYIYNNVPEEVKEKHFQKLEKEMIFVRL